MFFYNDNSSILFLATLINSDTSGFSNFCPNLCKIQILQKYSAKSNQKSSKLHERLQKALKRRKTVPKRCKKTLKIQNSSVVTKHTLLLTSQYLNLKNRPHQTSKEEQLVQPVFCIIDTGSYYLGFPCIHISDQIQCIIGYQ